MKDIQPYISPFIESQFPAFYQEEGPVFIQFVKTYYEWLEQSNNVLYHARRLLEYRDIDQTVEDFIVYFKEQTLKNIQFDVATNKRLLVKNALDVYRSKGTPRSVDLFFKLVYGKPAKVYYPADDILKLSDNTWKIPAYLEVTYTSFNGNFEGKQVRGLKSGATAFIESYIRKKKFNNQVDSEGNEVKISKNLEIFFISNIQGNFRYGEKIVYDGFEDPRLAPVIIGSLTDLSVITGASNYQVGDVVTLSSNTGYNGKAQVTSIINTTGQVEFELLDGGWGYSLTPKIIISDKVLSINTVSSSTRNEKPFKIFESLTQPKGNIVVSNPSSTINVGQTWNVFYNDSSITEYVKIGSVLISSFSVNTTASTANLYVSILSGYPYPISNTPGNPDVIADGDVYLHNTANSIIMNITSFVDKTSSANLMGFSTNNQLLIGDLKSNILFKKGETVQQENTSVGMWANAIVESISPSGDKYLLSVSNTNGSFLLNQRIHGQSSSANALIEDIRTTVGIYDTDEFTVQSVTIDNGGTGYTNGDLVFFSSEYGTGAIGVVRTGDYPPDYGVVDNVIMLNKGTGYIFTPTVSIPYSTNLISFNAYDSVDETLDFINLPNHSFIRKEAIKYTVDESNTAITNLNSGFTYYVRFSNSSGIKVSLTPSGSVINLSKGLPESGHYFSKAISAGNGFIGTAVMGNIFDFENNLFVTSKNSNTVYFTVVDTGGGTIIGYSGELTDYFPSGSYALAQDSFIYVKDHFYANGDKVTFNCSPETYYIGKLVNNFTYYISSANSIGFSLSYANGSAASLTPFNASVSNSSFSTVTTSFVDLIGEGSLADLKISSLDDEETVALNSDLLSGYNIYGVPFNNLKIAGSRLRGMSGYYSEANGILITANGAYYNSLVNNEIVFEDNNTGNGATAFFTNNATGNITSITILNYGSGFTSSPTISIGGRSFNAKDIVFDFIKLGSNIFANGDYVTYLLTGGATALTNLANNKSYYVVAANSIGVKLSDTFNGDSIDLVPGLTQTGHYLCPSVNFNANSGVNTTTDVISFKIDQRTFNSSSQVNSQSNFITVPSNEFVNGNIIKYLVSPGNTALTNLSNNSNYYVIDANTSGIRLSNTKFGNAINLTAGLSQTGHTLSLVSNPFSNGVLVRYIVSPGNTAISGLTNYSDYYVISSNSTALKLSLTSGGAAVNITKGLTQNGHNLTSTVSNALVFNSNSDIVSNFIPIEYNPLAVNLQSRYFSNGMLVKYFVKDGNTAVSGLSNTSTYYIVAANTSGIKLSSTIGGTPIAITSGQNETGHVLVPGNGASFQIVAQDPHAYNDPYDVYGFPAYPSGNLINETIQNQLTFEQLTIGSITGLNRINPGDDYTLDPFVTIVEPLVASYRNYDMILTTESDTSGFALNEDVYLLRKKSFDGSVSNVVSGTIYMNDHDFVNNEILVYNTATGSQVIGGLANGESYYVVQTTLGSFRLSIEEDGPAIELVATDVSSVHTVKTGNQSKLGTITKKVNNTTLKVRKATMFLNIDDTAKNYIKGESSNYESLVTKVENDLTFSGLNSTVEANVIIANGAVSRLKVIDSGYAYAQNDIVSFQKEGNPDATVGLAKVGVSKQGYGTGFYQTTKSFLSEDKYLQDSDFYQDYSYQIISRIPFERYELMLKKVLHVAGTKMFPAIEIESEQDASIKVGRTIDLSTNFNPVSNVDVINDFVRLGVLSGQKYFNASSVNSITGFIPISSNKFKANQEVVYLVSSGNTVIDPLLNDKIYNVIYSNSTGVVISNTYNGNAIILIPGINESGHSLSLFTRHPFANGDLVSYFVETGNTVIPGYSNNQTYYVSYANTIGFKLATTANGLYSNGLSSVVNILPTPPLVNEVGHNIQRSI